MRNLEEPGSITLLGNQQTEYKTDYPPETLEVFDNKPVGNDYFV